jgi:uncharacterized membrane protein YphA (DoxX/SURF4 family)
MTPAPLPESRIDRRLRHLTLLIARFALPYLFFSQLFWKLPPHFGCPEQASFAFTTVDRQGTWHRTSGLCDWIGVESVRSRRDATFFNIDFDNDGKPDVGLNLNWLLRLNGAFVDEIVIPQFAVFGWLIFLTELAVIMSMLFGLLTRAGAILSLLLSVQLALGVGGVSELSVGIQEWEWSYHLMVIVSLLLIGSPPGRILGVDAVLRNRFTRTIHGSDRRSKWLLYLT